MLKVNTSIRLNDLTKTILFLVLGIILFSNPKLVTEVVIYAIAGIFIIIGIVNILIHYRISKTGFVSHGILTSGIVAALFGIILILGSDLIEGLLRLIIGFWILYSGFLKLRTAAYFKKCNSKSSFATGIVAVVMILAGVYTIFYANLPIKIIGAFIIFYSIINLIDFISNNLFNKEQIEVLTKKK